uniref:Un-named sa1614 n=1 Tax=Scophthalmus maximus TaxID=52904 RepID=A0A8D3E2E6_SCOMX
MPECVSVSEFVQEVQEDWSSPTTSSFTAKMINCRNTVYLLEEALDSDRLVLQKMKKAAKAKYTSGQDHVCHLEQYIHSMEKLSLNCHSNGETEVGSAFCRLADFSKELVSPMKNLVIHQSSFPSASLQDLKKPFDRSWRDYESRFKQIEKEKRELARQYGMVRTEVSGGEIAEELEKERRSFQLSMCEYLIKVNEIKTKRGVDLLQNLIKHYHSHNNFLQECVSTTQRLKQYMEELNGVLTTVKQRNEDEKRQLCSLRDQLRPAVPTEQQDSLPKQVYSMHQLLGDKQYGTERSGFLYKKSDGLRKMWQKRKCSVHNCYLTIAHATPNKPPTRLNLLTCQVKPSVEDKKCFDLISHNRTYHFLAEDEAECVAWISVLSNSKQEALSVALDGGRRGAGGGESSVEDLTRTITDDIRRMPGNTNCCDCGAPDPGWLSTNLGILTCIECSGIHREMGVHVSRIHSLNLDSLGTSDLLLARNVGNSGFNEILEANLLSPSLKPSQHSHMAERKDFILLKYQDVHFVRRSHSSNAALRLGLQEATKSCDIYSLIQLHAQRTELSQPLHTHIQEKGETAIHLAVLLADRTSLHILDFLAQNCSNVDMQTTAGNTALHYSCLHNKSDCVKLLLRARANTHIKNELGETALDVSRKLKHSHCEALLQQAQSNQFDHHVHVEYEWRLRHDDLYDSDDDFDDKVTTATERLLVYLLYSFSVQEQNRVVLTNGPVKKERTSSSSSSFTSSFSFTSRPFSFSQSVAPPSSAAPGAPGGGLLSVGRRLAMAMDLHSRTSGTAPSPPPPPPSSPAPPLPPRVKGQFTSIDYQSQITSRPQLTCVQIHLQHHLLDVHQPRGAASRRVQALYDCQADHHDELSFTEGQVLVVLGQDDCDWWHGYIEDEPDQRGLFPSSFVQLFSD